MIYAALAALLLVQASGEPVSIRASVAGQDGPIMHHGRDLLTEQMNCGGLGMEVCDDGSCELNFVPVNLGGESTICRKPEEAPGGGPDNGTSGAKPPVDEANCGGLGNEVCGDGECDDDLVPVNMGGLSTICRKPEEAAAAEEQAAAEDQAVQDTPVEPEQPAQPPQPEQPAQPPQPEQPAETPAESACGSGGQPVCAGEQLDDREFECDYGFVGGDDDLCVPWQPEQPAQPPQPEQPAQPPQPEQPAQPPQPEQPAQTPADDPVDPPADPPADDTTPPPDGDFEFSGELTYYGGAGAGGACTSTWVPDGFVTFALNSPQYEATNECGTCVYACWVNEELGTEERCVEGIIDNLCPECAFGDLDLGEGGSGRWPVEWNKITCPSDGITFSHQGSNASYAKVKVEGGPSSATGMTCNGMEGSPTPDGYFEFNAVNAGLDQGMSCDVTFSDGSTESASGV